MNVCTRRLDWRTRPPHDADSCACAPERALSAEEARRERVDGAISELVEDGFKDFTLEDLDALRMIIEIEIDEQRKRQGPA
jgi:hypothetical protein